MIVRNRAEALSSCIQSKAQRQALQAFSAGSGEVGNGFYTREHLFLSSLVSPKVFAIEFRCIPVLTCQVVQFLLHCFLGSWPRQTTRKYTLTTMLGSIYAHPLLFCFLLFAFPFVYWKISIFREKRAIARLGSFAPQHRNGLPLGIDIVIKGINHARSDTAIEFWDWLMGLIPNKHSQTVEFHIAGRRTIYTADPENIKAILATQFTDYGKGKPFHDVWQDFLGDSIFTTDGEAWHNSRQLIRPQFVKNRVADLEIFEKHVSKLMSKIGGRGQEVDVAKLFYRFTLDSATDYLLGKSVDSLDNPQAQFVSAFAELQRMQCRIDGAGLFGQLLPKKTFWASLKVLNEFVNPFIERALRLGINELNEKENNSFLHALAATGTRDRKYLRDQVVAVLLAGRDTTAATLSFTFQELAKQPEIVRKLRREILERVGKNKAPTYDDLKNMPYLQHCMNETLRLYPSVPFNIRTSLHDTTLPTGGGPDGLQPIGKPALLLRSSSP